MRAIPFCGAGGLPLTPPQGPQPFLTLPADPRPRVRAHFL